MSIALEPGTLTFPARKVGSTGTAPAYTGPAASVPEMAWLTVTIRPAGTFGRHDTSRLRTLLDALSPCASMIVLDLRAAQLRSRGCGEVIEDTAWDLERRGGCLVCINVDAESRACLSAAGHHAVLMDDASQLVGLGEQRYCPPQTSSQRPASSDVSGIEPLVSCSTSSGT